MVHIGAEWPVRAPLPHCVTQSNIPKAATQWLTGPQVLLVQLLGWLATLPQVSLVRRQWAQMDSENLLLKHTAKAKSARCQCTKPLIPHADIKQEGPDDRCSSDVSCCCQGATSKLNPSSFTDLQRHLKGTRYKVETPALSWTRRWMRNGLMTVSHKVR